VVSDEADFVDFQINLIPSSTGRDLRFLYLIF
jgi:hypothetical protein